MANPPNVRVAPTLAGLGVPVLGAPDMLRAWVPCDYWDVLDELRELGMTIVDGGSRLHGHVTDGVDTVTLNLDAPAEIHAGCAASVVADLVAAERHPFDKRLLEYGHDGPPRTRFELLAYVAFGDGWDLVAKLDRQAQRLRDKAPFASMDVQGSPQAQTLTRLMLDRMDGDYGDVTVAINDLLDNPEWVAQAFALDSIKVPALEPQPRRIAKARTLSPSKGR